MAIEHSKHIFRIFILLAAVLAAAIVGKILVQPDSFGRYGHYRGDSVAENAEQEIRHGGDEACGECHDDIKETHDEGSHAGVRCENCHDALASHVRDGDKYADMPRVKSVLKLCGRCHAELDARPKDFPQVSIETHPVEQGAEEASDEVCFDCHLPHDPTP